jgi:carbon storage regulator
VPLIGPQDENDNNSKNAHQGLAMLVLSRKKDEKILIGDSITLMVIEIRGDKVRLGIDAPRDVTVHREEVYEAIRREQSPEDSTVEK